MSTSSVNSSPVNASNSAEVIVIVAMEEELAPFLQLAQSVANPEQVGNSIHRASVINGRNILLVHGGIGLVNASGAATSALLLTQQKNDGASPPLVISAGSAGGLGENVKVGDVVIGTDTINADADARAFGYQLGQVPGMPVSYPVPDALAAVSRVGMGSTQGSADTAGTATAKLVKTVHHGLIVSSYSFVDQSRAVVIKGLFEGALSTDMESSAIAQIAYAYNSPFLAIRGISDLCGPAAETDFVTHVDDAADRSAEIVRAVIDAWFAAGSPRP
ncbi:5'-methylthioadenosine/S-adenosylhomocysteine nucleosidase [Arthrobacter alpinus]|uniref:5'-methylthioadenosine/S-adenosylhomocysteine nucleosidase n=1 Tax=Arthrobacter alpinus TaxID=656366 RepID=UPI000A827A80|nr:5'-methylthioadenosine/S-adenosylhomocysteine nucleosidase [Arthrobacter alpinus]